MTPRFAPIAIVGRACVLPGALTPAQLWEAVATGRDLTSSVPDERWGLPRAAVLAAAATGTTDRSVCDRGGYVRGFDSVWRPDGFAVAPGELAGLDPLVHWVMHCAREALHEAARVDRARCGLILGNLGFPSEHMARYAQGVWSGQGAVDPRNRFMSAGTAGWVKRALALGGRSFCLDAACASSLYALKLACDALHDGEADVMLAGAVQRADDLFLHMGFTALSALSPSGRSRPFHREADGLLPAEGAAIFALKRLRDARRDGDHIHGVIRGIGLSNDGRGKGLLVPDEAGQRRAIRAAFAAAGLRPKQVTLLECHATGTPVGDATEVRSTAAEYQGCTDLPVGSLKSNLGHLITTAGAAGLIKVLEAMRAGQRPPTLHHERPIEALHGSPFRLLHALEPWDCEGARVAGVSAFGFGGNNAHLLVSEDDAGIDTDAPTQRGPVAIAVVGLGCRVAACSDRAQFAEALFANAGALDSVGEGRASDIDLTLEGLRIPPNDLAQALPQQLAVLQAAREALANAATSISGERTAVLIGMEPDPEVARYGLRWRLESLLGSETSVRRDDVVPALQSAAVLGCMPNIPANRLSQQFDCGGPGFAVQAGGESGLQALQLAVRALRAGEIDQAIVGAVDFSCEPVHRAASAALGHDVPAGDAAVVCVLKRLDDAERAGDRILAQMPATAQGLAGVRPDPRELDTRFGRAYAAAGMVEFAAATLCLHHRRQRDGRPWLATPRAVAVGQSNLQLRQADCAKPIKVASRIYNYAAADRAGLIDALRSGREGREGSARLALVATPAEFERLRQRALDYLTQGSASGPGIYFRERPLRGGVAFCFPGAGAAYHGMGRELLQQMPGLLDDLAVFSATLGAGLEWAYAERSEPTALQQLQAASALSQIHVRLSEDRLGLRADAWLGYSSGETNALFAAGVWRDADALMRDMTASGLMDRELGGQFAAVSRAWGAPATWANWSVMASPSEVQAALQDIPRVHLAIIHSDQECMIAGDVAGCERAVERLGRARCLRMDYALAVHVPEVRVVEEAWLQLHQRDCQPPRSGRVYSSGLGHAYETSRENCAQAILQQATRCLDLRPAILQAWNDGIRVFVEHGPGSSYARAIRQTLGTRDALVISLDRKGQGIEGLQHAAAALFAAGVAADLDALADLSESETRARPSRTLKVAAHPPSLHLARAVEVTNAVPTPNYAPERTATPQWMAPAPPLPSVLAPLSGLEPTPRLEARSPAFEAVPSQADSINADNAHMDDAVAANDRTGLPALGPQSSSHGERPVVSPVQAHLAQVTSLHQTFLRRQSEVQQRFLQLRQAAVQSLLQAAANGDPGTIMLPATVESPVRALPEVRSAARPIAQEHDSVQRPPVSSMPQRSPEGPSEASTAATQPRSQPTLPRPAGKRTPCGPQFDREQLLVHAGGAISQLFGPKFTHQDGYARQVRMPLPPLLLADRVTGIDAEPDSMGKGVIWTETDVGSQDWYLHHGRMPAGVLIEAGQADLMLISYLGVDRLNRGERVYRLLGCELTYHGDLPRTGDTLRFEITLDGHAAQGDVRLMFFHYDCHNGDRLQLSVRKGQAGFFSDAELAASAGCLWRPEEQAIVDTPRLDPPAVSVTRRAFDRAHLEAFAAGDAYGCFGPGFEFAKTHTRSPSIGGGRMLLQDRVTAFDAAGGPWRRGYLRAELDIRPQQWFFDGHFKNDPCMPGTLMFEGCLQMLGFYLAACGFTLRRDGWRFQPVPELPYQLQCRGQVLPSSQRLVTEVFVEELIAGPVPTIYADLLCTVDGLKAFHARRVALQLVPDWPLDSLPDSTIESDPRPIAVVDGFAFDRRSLLACAYGRPSQAFGPMYRRFDGPTRVARLPSPPYHFISRISEVHGAIGELKAGARVVAEYDVPDDVWYLDQNGCRRMPFAVLLEAALQPCGWLSSYVGSALTVDAELGFRNLDGEGTVLAELAGDAGTLRCEVELRSISATAGMIIESFSVRCALDDRPVYTLDTVFGFFPPDALAAQAGLPTRAEHRELLQRPANRDLDLATLAADGTARLGLPGDMLRMIDRLQGFWPEGGAAGLGQLRALKTIDAGEWFFKAHFFQDPVQPGSLGLEAMLQLLQVYLLLTDAGEGIDSPRFESIALDRPHQWKYRGQVLPQHREVHTTLEITERGRDDRGVYAIGNASLWADGQRIYEASGLGVRIVSGRA